MSQPAFPPQPPQSVVTLLTGDPADTKLYVAEHHDVIVEALRGDSPIVTFSRLRDGIDYTPFSTQRTNVVNVEVYR